MSRPHPTSPGLALGMALALAVLLSSCNGEPSVSEEATAPASAAPTPQALASATRGDTLGASLASTLSPTAVPTRTPRPTFMPRATPRPTRTSTPWPAWMPDPEPLRVRFSLESLVATQEARFGAAELEGRVERAYFVRAEQLVRVLRERDALPLRHLTHPLSIFVPEEGELRKTERWNPAPRGYAVVEASHLEVYDRHYPLRPLAEITPSTVAGTSFGPERVRWVSIHDVEDPIRASQYETRVYWDDAIGEAMAAFDPPWVLAPDPPSPTATRMAISTPPSATPLPLSYPDVALPSQTPMPLATGEVPSVLVDAASELGLVPGARWRYRAIHWRAKRVFESGEATMEVAEAWRLAPDVMGIRLRMSPADSVEWLQAGSLIRFVLPQGAIAGPKWPHAEVSLEDSIEEQLRMLADPQAIGADTACAWLVPTASNPWIGLRDRCYTRLGGDATVQTPAGTFQGCYETGRITSASTGSSMWHCPFVGVVRIHHGGVQGMAPLGSHWDLIGYEIPPLVPVP